MLLLTKVPGYLQEVSVWDVGDGGPFNLMFFLNTQSVPHAGQASLRSEF